MAHRLSALETRGTAEERVKMKATTLLFHDIVENGRWEASGFQGADADVYKLDCGEFRACLEAIKGALRGEVITGLELLGREFESDPALLTFDDGGVSAANHAADILDEFGWKAHFLVTTGRIGTAGFLDGAQIQQLRRRGHIIGSHSHTHPIRMAYCTDSELRDEWRRSAGVLSDMGEPVETASVPGGYYSRRVAAAAASAGIKLLFNSEPVTHGQTVDGCLVLGRFTAKRGQRPERLAAIVAGDRKAQAQQYLFWNAKKLAKRLLGKAWLRARLALLERRGRS